MTPEPIYEIRPLPEGRGFALNGPTFILRLALHSMEKVRQYAEKFAGSSGGEIRIFNPAGELLERLTVDKA